jgi:transcriptional regulator with XRE-family HTH domain
MAGQTPGSRREWGRQLRDERKDRGLTQTEVAELVGVPQDAVSRAETGRGGIELYERLAHALDVELAIIPGPVPS